MPFRCRSLWQSQAPSLWGKMHWTQGCWLSIGLALLGVLSALGCRRSPSPDTQGPLVVAVTIPPYAWLVRQIGGDGVQVEVMISGQSDPHSFQLSDADVTRLARARVFFVTGMPFEQSPACRQLLQGSGVRVIDLRQELAQGGLIPSRLVEHDHSVSHGHPAEHDHSEEHGHGLGEDGNHPHHEHQAHDPSDHETAGADAHPAHTHQDFLHIWLSPRLLRSQAETVARVLEEVDPASRDRYRKGLAAVSQELDALDAELREKLAALRGQTFFVYHPAWECFADAYDLRQEAMEREGKPPSDHELSQLQQSVAKTPIKLILIQPQIASPAAVAMADEIGLRVVSVDPLAAEPLAELRRLAELLLSAYREGNKER